MENLDTTKIEVVYKTKEVSTEIIYSNSRASEVSLSLVKDSDFVSYRIIRKGNIPYDEVFNRVYLVNTPINTDRFSREEIAKINTIKAKIKQAYVYANESAACCYFSAERSYTQEAIKLEEQLVLILQPWKAPYID